MTEVRKLFLSAVSGDFREERNYLARDLRRTSTHVEDQEHFRSRGGLLLKLLDDYIRECAAVVHLIGGKAGHLAKAEEVQFIRDNYPDFLTRFPELTDLLDSLSYTQWEAWLALYHRKRLHVWVHTPAVPLAMEPAQQKHLSLLQERGEFWPPFVDREDLRTHVLAGLHDLLPPEEKHQPVNLPYRSLGSLFKGREPFMQQLREKLLLGETHAVGVLAAQSIHGLGGIGKTRAAVEFAWRHQAEFSALLFVTADSPENLERNLAGLVGPLVLNLTDAQQVTDQTVQMQAALQWLQTHQRWFLILDNVDDEATARVVQQLAAQLTQGRILITSRVAKWSKGVETLELDVLAEDDARNFLLERTEQERQHQPEDATRALAIARDLDGLALALEQAGAYIAELGLSLAQYQQRWESKRDQVLSWYDERIMEYPRSLAVTWETSFAQLSPAGRTLLEHLCWLAPEPIPQYLFDDQGRGRIDPATENIEELWQELMGDDVFAALGNLVRYSLLKRDQAENIPTVVVHRLVQEITRRRLEQEPALERLKSTLRVLDVAWPGSAQDVRTWPRWNLLAPHYIAATTFADGQGLADPTARLMNNVAQLYDAKSLLSQAEPLMRRALAIDEAAYGPEHPDVASYLNNLAQLLQATNRLAEAEPLMRRALAIDEAAYGPEHPNVAIRLNNLAQLLQDTNRLAEAEPLMRRALAIDEASYGPEHPDVASDLNNLAQLLKATNRLAEAEPLMRRALAMGEASYGPEHPNVAIRLNNLAQLLKATNRLAEAEPLMRRVVEIFEIAYGENHPNVATALNNLAQLLQATNRLAEAEPLMRRSLAIAEAAYGPKHPKVAIRLNNLAGLLQATNRLAEAEPLMRRALAIDEASYGPEHPDVAIDLNNLALLLQATNRLAEAEPLMRRALAIDEAAYGPEHPDVARDLNNLAQLLQATNRLAEAEPLMRRAVDIFRTSLGAEHPNTQTVQKNYNRLLQEMPGE